MGNEVHSDFRDLRRFTLEFRLVDVRQQFRTQIAGTDAFRENYSESRHLLQPKQ